MSESYVSVTLAHPLDAHVAVQVGLENRPYPVGSQVTMLRRDAMKLVSAGLIAGADPTNIDSVARALKPVKRPAPAPAASKS